MMQISVIVSMLAKIEKFLAKSVCSAYAWYTFKFLWNNSGITFKHVACKQDKGECKFTGLSNVLYQFGLKAS